MNLVAIKTLVIHTIQREFRNRTLLILSILTILALMGGFHFLTSFVASFIDENAHTETSLFQANNQTLKIFLSLLSSWITMVTILIGVNMVRSDEEENVLHQMLALPIRRGDYLLARTVGSLIMAYGFYLVSSFIVLVLFMMNAQDGLDYGLWLGTLWPMFLLCLGLLFVSLLCSLFLPKVFAVIFSLLGFFLITNANSAYFDKPFWATFMDASLGGKVQALITLVAPPLGMITRTQGLFLDGATTLSHWLWMSAHALVGFAVIFFVLQFFFQRRDL